MQMEHQLGRSLTPAREETAISATRSNCQEVQAATRTRATREPQF